jgi:hypothetical protein
MVEYPRGRIVGLFFTAVIVSGCAVPQKDAFYISNDFKPVGKQEIYLLPTVNSGMDESLDTDLDKASIVKGIAKKRGYKFVDGTKAGNLPKITPEMLDNLDFGWVSQLPLEKNTWVFIPSVDYLSRFVYGFGMRADAFVTGDLVDYPSGRLLWEGEGYGFMQVGFFLTAMADDGAVEMAMTDLMYSLPPRESASGASLARGDLYHRCVGKICSDTLGGTTAHICVLRDKSTSFLDEKKSTPGPKKLELHVPIYSLYDGPKDLGKVKAGQYRCWDKTPGRTVLHLGKVDMPIYFRAAPGVAYYWHAAYNYSRGWVYDQLPPGTEDSILAGYTPARSDADESTPPQ